MARRKWKQLRVRGAAAAAASFTGPLTPVCWAEGRGVALLGGLNILGSLSSSSNSTGT